jgi:hypothetical protein
MLVKSLKSLPRLGLFLLLLTASYSAQAQSADRMVVNIPFEFSAGNVRLPAGEYSVKRTSATASAFTIQRTDSSAAAIVLAVGTVGGGAEQQGGARLVLRRYGHMYFLAQVWMPGRGTGSQIPESRSERRLRREVSAKDGRPEQVVLLAGRR